VTAPVVAALRGTVSLVAIPANVLAEPAVAPATMLGFSTAVLAPFWPFGGAALATLAGWPCRWLVFIADRAGAIPAAAFPWPAGVAGALTLAAATVGMWLAFRRRGVGRLLVAAVVVVAVVRIPASVISTGWPPAGWDLVACDVGQGDGLVLPAAPHVAVVVDTGPAPTPIDRCLRGLGVRTVRLLLLTHFHLDHVGGILGVLHDRTVGAVMVGPLAEPVSGVELVRDALAPGLVPVTQAAVGERLAAGNVRISVLGPAAAMHGTRSDPNNSSVVLRAAVGDLTILLPGDAEVEEQDALLGAGTDVHADILKVPHHGSAYSDPAFLAATSASLGVISVGLHNDYGHPSPTLLQEMAALAVPLRRTDLDGDVAVTGDRAHLAAVVHGPTDPALQAAAQTRPALRSASRRGILIVAMLAACPASGAPTVLARAARTPCTGGIRAAVAARGRPP
jgi:competence protein ComEC